MSKRITNSTSIEDTDEDTLIITSSPQLIELALILRTGFNLFTLNDAEANESL